MSPTARKLLALVSAVVIIFAAGHLSGLMLASGTGFTSSNGPAGAVEGESHTHRHVHEDDEEEHIALTEQAFLNLGLRLGSISLQDYWKSRTMPGEVVEIPGQSIVSVSAPVTGVIESLRVRPGEAVHARDNLFTIRMTDQDLTAAQTKFLAGMSRMEILTEEIARLAPLTSAGAVVGRRKRELEFELAQLQSAQTVLRQEMSSRGLTDAVINNIADTRTLANMLEVSAPSLPLPADEDSSDSRYSVGHIAVRNGQSVERGESLCALNNHRELYVRGQAFESDLRLLERLAKQGWNITAEFGHLREQSGEQVTTRSDLKLLRVDNVVDPETQTFSFFLQLSNEMAQTIVDNQGRAFHHWRFKPGQRVRLRVPVEQWSNQIVLPLEAVMLEGPNATVFVEHTEELASPQTLPTTAVHVVPRDDLQGEEAAFESIFIELEPVPVRLLHRDDRFAVIADDGQLDHEQRIALNAAFELHETLKLQAGSGGGHHHHDH